MPTDPALPRRAGELTIPRHASLPAPSIQTVSPDASDELPEPPGTSFGGLHQADVQRSLGAVGLVCRSVLACLIAIVSFAGVLIVLLWL